MFDTLKNKITEIINKIKERIEKYKKEYILFLICCVLLDRFVRYASLSYNIKEEKNYSNFRKNIFKIISGSFITTTNPFLHQISHFVKGENYLVQFSKEKITKYRKECIVTCWNFFHFIAHFVAVFMFPYFFREIFLLSFLYEIYEYIVFKCHDLSDIVYNIMGIYLGYNSRKFIDTY